jgi:hypothetical protein
MHLNVCIMNRLFGLSTLVFLTAFCFANISAAQTQVSTEFIIINPDGTVDPATSPIARNGDIYTLTGDTTGFLIIARNNTVFDGATHAIQGIFGPLAENSTYYTLSPLSLNVNVTIVNCVIDGGWISFLGLNNSVIANNTISNGQGLSWVGDDNYISGNNITHSDQQARGMSLSGTLNIVSRNRITAVNGDGITVGGFNNSLIDNYIVGCNGAAFDLGMSSHHNSVIENYLAENKEGVRTLSVYSQGSCHDNLIYCNNFINNTNNVNNSLLMTSEVAINIWDNGTIGNYWSNYNGTDLNNDGIGDTPYVLDSNNQDRFPLITPYEQESSANQPFPSPLPSPTPTSTPSPKPTQTPTLKPAPTSTSTLNPTQAPTTSPSPTIWPATSPTVAPTTPPTITPEPSSIQSTPSPTPAMTESSFQVDIYWLGIIAVVVVAVVAGLLVFLRRNRLRQKSN